MPVRRFSTNGNVYSVQERPEVSLSCSAGVTVEPALVVTFYFTIKTTQYTNIYVKKEKKEGYRSIECVIHPLLAFFDSLFYRFI